MNRLSELRSRLNALRRRRRIARLGTALGSLAAAFLWLLAAAFVVDWTFEMNRPQRVLSLAFVSAGALWALAKYLRPLLGPRESIIDMALCVERQERIDSDLVAALQFESREAPSWGSRNLEEAVISYVADYSRELNVLEGFSWRGLALRAGFLGLTACSLGALSASHPGHTRAFFDRLLLGSTHYPTRTRIEKILVSGREVLPGSAALRVPYGRSLDFEVECSGELPERCEVELRSPAGSAGTSEAKVELLPSDGAGSIAIAAEAAGSAAATAGATAGGTAGGASEGTTEGATEGRRRAAYAGSFPRLCEAVEYTVRAGDAWTDPARIEVIPLPVVRLDLRPEPPAYAGSDKSEPGSIEGLRQISVLEGSAVDLALVCENKALRQATFAAGAKENPLAPEGEARRRWILRPDVTPLRDVREPVHYSIQVLDDDGLGLESPLEGSIRIKPDRKPRVAAAMVSQHVLPRARPAITYGAADDHGVARIEARIQVAHEDGRNSTRELKVIEVPPASQPREVLRGRFTLDLEPLGLVKGDQLTVSLEAFDFRGEGEGKSASSDPMVLHVTDERGLLSAMMSADERSAQQLDLIIERQLGIGGSQ